MQKKKTYFEGSLFELPVSGGEVGDTNARIIADQFHKLKFGDRFSFSHEQDEDIDEVR